MKNVIKKVYCDTSVIGGVLDSEFSDHSKSFLKSVKSGLFNLVVSPVVDAEIYTKGTQLGVIEAYENLQSYASIVPITEDAIQLQQAYISSQVLTMKWKDDALHVALATINFCDFIVSWNFKHIVNFKKIPLYNAINVLNGYREIEIYSPLELEYQ